MIGSSAVFLNAVEQARRVARSDARVLIEGESGTGKELLAGLIHRESPFADGPFIRVNCAAIPKELIEAELFGHEKGAFTGASATRRGRFELADGGTLFLDEVGDLHESSQAKLLRVLQEGEFQRVGGEQTVHVRVRVLTASNRNLGAMVGDGRFRGDLFYRLSVVPIRMPALRERREDIPPMAVHFLKEFCRRNGFRTPAIDGAVLEILQAYAWPGNVRELKNIVERMAILCSNDRITVDSIPVEFRFPAAASPSTLQHTRDAAERDRILEALDRADWNVSAAAQSLNVERTNLHKRIRALRLERE
jgi:two-component system nitrogen regulation response regulator NtrX